MRKTVVYAILAVCALALLVRAVGTHLQPAVPAKATGGLTSYIAVLLAVAALVANFKDISELLQGLLHPSAARASGSADTAAATALKRRNRERMLEKVRTIWITGLLERALPPAARIPLRLEPAAEAVILPFTLEVRELNLPPRPLEPGTPILAVFDQLGGGLLLLGDPGAGKTMLLLELARDLIRRAQRDPSQPIPIVLNLSSWADKRKPLGQWLLDELVLQYQVPRQVGADWLEAGELLLLLDGLDEVRAEHRQECVRAINAYRQQQGFVPLAVCSRSADYAMLTSKLKLGGAVVIQPLSREQVDTYLANQGRRLAAARALVTHDPVFGELAQTPLILSLIAQTFDNETIGQDPTLASAETWRQRLFYSYVHQMLGRRGARAPYGEQETIRWLVFLARKMQEHNVSVFALENLQKTWLASRRQIILYEGMVAGMAGVLVCFVWSLISLHSSDPTWVKVLFVLFFGFGISSLGYWLHQVEKPIESLEAIGWSWLSFQDGLKINLIVVCSFASIFGAAVAISIGNSASGLAAFVLFVIIELLYRGMLAARCVKKMITPSTTPNYGIRQSAKVIAVNLIFISLLFACVGAVGGILVFRALGTYPNTYLSHWLAPPPDSSLAIVVALGALFGCLGLFLGLKIADPYVVLGHLSLRILLAGSNLLPLNLVRFLDFCDERMILTRVGGNYLFFHRLLLDCFAALAVLPAEACRLDHAAEEIASRKRRLFWPFFRAARHFDLAIALLDQGDLPQASQHFRISLGLRPKAGLAENLAENVYLGVLAWHAGQEESAQQAFEAALRVYDSSVRSGINITDSLEFRCCALLGLGRVEEAEAALRQALASLPAIEGRRKEMWRFLLSSEHPPQGIERLTALLSPP